MATFSSNDMAMAIIFCTLGTFLLMSLIFFILIKFCSFPRGTGGKDSTDGGRGHIAPPVNQGVNSNGRFVGDVDGNLGGSGGGGTEEGVVWVKKRPEHDLNFNIEQSEGNEFVITDLDASPELMQQIDQGDILKGCMIDFQNCTLSNSIEVLQVVSPFVAQLQVEKKNRAGGVSGSTGAGLDINPHVAIDMQSPTADLRTGQELDVHQQQPENRKAGGSLVFDSEANIDETDIPDGQTQNNFDLHDAPPISPFSGEINGVASNDVNIDVPNRSFQSSRKPSASEISFDAILNASNSRKTSMFASGPDSKEVHIDIDLGVDKNRNLNSENPRMALETPSARTETKTTRNEMEMDTPEMKKKGLFACCGPSQKSKKSPKNPHPSHNTPTFNAETNIDTDVEVGLPQAELISDDVIRSDTTRTADLFAVAVDSSLAETPEVDHEMKFAVPEPSIPAEVPRAGINLESSPNLNISNDKDFEFNPQIDVDKPEMQKDKKFGVGGNIEKDANIEIQGIKLNKGFGFGDFDVGDDTNNETEQPKLKKGIIFGLEGDSDADADVGANLEFNTPKINGFGFKTEADGDLPFSKSKKPEVDFAENYDKFAVETATGEDAKIGFEGYEGPSLNKNLSANLNMSNGGFNLDGIDAHNEGFDFGISANADGDEARKTQSDLDARLEKKVLPSFERDDNHSKDGLKVETHAFDMDVKTDFDKPRVKTNFGAKFNDDESDLQKDDKKNFGFGTSPNAQDEKDGFNFGIDLDDPSAEIEKEARLESKKVPVDFKASANVSAPEFLGEGDKEGEGLMGKLKKGFGSMFGGDSDEEQEAKVKQDVNKSLDRPVLNVEATAGVSNEIAIDNDVKMTSKGNKTPKMQASVGLDTGVKRELTNGPSEPSDIKSKSESTGDKDKDGKHVLAVYKPEYKIIIDPVTGQKKKLRKRRKEEGEEWKGRDYDIKIDPRTGEKVKVRKHTPRATSHEPLSASQMESPAANNRTSKSAERPQTSLKQQSPGSPTGMPNGGGECELSIDTNMDITGEVDGKASAGSFLEAKLPSAKVVTAASNEGFTSRKELDMIDKSLEELRAAQSISVNASGPRFGYSSAGIGRGSDSD